MKLALLTDANPKLVTKSHPSFVGTGKYRIVATGVKSKLTGRRIPINKPADLVTAVSIGDIFEGECLIEILIIEANPEDLRITVFAEKVTNV